VLFTFPHKSSKYCLGAVYYTLMFRGFWQDLPQPIIGLSPMDGVTDQPFRRLQKKIGGPDIVMTEFTASEGVMHNALKLFDDFLYDESQRPVIAQIFGNNPRAFYVTAVILGYLGFDGIDINMGCPAKTVQQSGSGAALILKPELAQEIVRATRQGIQDWANGVTLDDLPELKEKTKTMVLGRQAALPAWAQERRELPVSVKTRVGYDKIVIREWIQTLLEVEPATITVHGRTLKQMYSGLANWEAIAEAVDVTKGTETAILGNGDIHTIADFERNVRASGVAGALIGRATFGDPWLLKDMKTFRDQAWDAQNAAELAANWQRPELSWQERVDTLLTHTRLFESTFPDMNFMPMRKHLGWYMKGFPGASDLRVALVRANSSEEVANILEQFGDPGANPSPAPEATS
jgi:tRNA-dihydrouridine synthase B